MLLITAPPKVQRRFLKLKQFRWVFFNAPESGGFLKLTLLFSPLPYLLFASRAIETGFESYVVSSQWASAESGLMESKDQLQTPSYAADIQSIEEALLRIAPYIHKTPVLSSTSLDSIAGRQLFFKCECFQKGGAFKIRGASNAIFSLDDNEVDKGVLTHSSGNHAAAVSLAAKLRGIPAYIVIPKNAPKCKVENVKRYGGQVIWSEATLESRESIGLARFSRQTRLQL
ncbi:uncharacterized protein A4U43_C04F9470 [Asparagus officinalis]|uniref:Tryptophan synthase beta chain-like PALP domain-containing protein n=1 Tax=Asparagus officinalis TaxID=4686 RepID=A0A5P1EZI2_ASPOF|nr:uncharacterized protein A4U43_C04F9470 [Asparagus officinalis]